MLGDNLSFTSVMADNQIEAAKPKSDDNLAHTLTAFAQSLAYSGLESPARAAAQIVDRYVSTTIEDRIQSAFNNIGIHKPEEAVFGTKAWAAEQLGSSIGMIAPMWLARKTTASFAGFTYGAILTPCDDVRESSDFTVNRIKQGLNSAVTFGAIRYSSSLSGEFISRTANKIESFPLPSALKSSLQTGLQSRLLHGALGGISGGIVQAQLTALENGKPFATVEDIKENIVSMSMIGATMGSVGYLRKTPLELPSQRYSDAIAKPEFSKFSSFDINFEPIQKAWTPSEVDKFKTVETREIEFPAADRDSKIAQADWDNFSSWAIERRKVPVNVYRFAGLETEIVVPSEYAHMLDQIRLQRLNLFPQASSTHSATDAISLTMRENRILPEEMAQVLARLPKSNIVKTVELLDHARADDLQKNHEEHVQLAAQGLPGPYLEGFTLADADLSGSAVLRFFQHSDNEPSEMQRAVRHEFAHLAQSNPAFKIFPQAANLERNGFFFRDYARENDDENWAIHFGERFLHPHGAAFSELADKAPARTLVMVKALRNMLEDSNLVLSPQQRQYLARAEAAENLATTSMQAQILKDISTGDFHSLNEKLGFLNVAASSTQTKDY